LHCSPQSRDHKGARGATSERHLYSVPRRLNRWRIWPRWCACTTPPCLRNNKRVLLKQRRTSCMTNHVSRLFILAIRLLSVSALCFGQAGRAELSGTIQDPSGLPVPKAKVEAEDQATMARYSVLSDDRGEYHV